MTIPSSAPLTTPLSEDRGVLLARLTDGLDVAALHWVSGYVAGLAAHAQRGPRPLQAVVVNEAGGDARLTIVYGSQTGNARREAERLAADAEATGLTVRLLRADAYPVRELPNERLLYVVVSTQGDGDPPDDARAFVDFLAGRRAPALKDLRYAVLGLGDSSYAQFNAIGRRVDARLAELGAQRLFASGEADVDVETVAAPWRQQALTIARESLKSSPALATVTALRPAAATSWTRDRPFAAELIANQRITGRDSDHDVRHVELALADPALVYEPGDALGVWPRNAPALVDEILATLSLDGDSAVRRNAAAARLARHAPRTDAPEPAVRRQPCRAGERCRTQPAACARARRGAVAAVLDAAGRRPAGQPPGAVERRRTRRRAASARAATVFDRLEPQGRR
jgi:sulfite reductase (NADPH) flavoprotein alpha-component